jgi:hypothetical protein
LATCLSKRKITNGPISLSFAKGILAEKNEIKVNWVCYPPKHKAWEEEGTKNKLLTMLKY